MVIFFFLFASVAGATNLKSLTLPFVDDHEAKVTLSDFMGKRVVVSMFYTDCTRTCPLTVKKMMEIKKRLEEKSEVAEFILITFDPKGDTPSVIKEFRQEHKMTEAQWHFWRGSEQNTKEMAKVWDSWKYHDHIVHDFRILVFGKSGELEHDFKNPDDPAFKNPNLF
jgi:cytochrome oxidase Cu insertion factor (SCO1/SenC/PrrC family)